VAERRSVAADVVGSKPTSRPKIFSRSNVKTQPYGSDFESSLPQDPKSPQPVVFEVAAAPALPVPTRIYAGTSGWAYPLWKPGFYPAKLPAKRFLEHYATRLNSVEVNYTFRAFPTASMQAGWVAATPAGFRFSFKAPQRITHFKRLRDCDVIVADFVAALEPVRQAGKLGPLLFQLPPNFKADATHLAAFLAAPALTGPAAPQIAFEFRHQSWFTEEIYAILRAHNAALCVAESDDLSTPEMHCSSTSACFRLRRTGGYTDTEIAAFADRLTALASTRDVYVYLKHEDDPTGALNAEALLNACTGSGPR
jgi:uncharacterized protein YecE (DUF72 family)